MIKTNDPLALFYNDKSPMENHHLVRRLHTLPANSPNSSLISDLMMPCPPKCVFSQAAAFMLLQDNSYNFLKSMPTKAKAGLRKQAIEAVVRAAAIQALNQSPAVIV